MTKYAMIHPATFKLDGGAMFGIIPRPLWSKVMPPDDQNRILMSLRVMLIQTPSKNILIDSGIGDYHGDKFDERFAVIGGKNPLATQLQNSKLNPDAISDIILTHLHFDHVGGLGQLSSQGFEPVFPKATIHLHKKHFQYAQNPTERDSGSFEHQYFMPLIKWYQDHNQIHWLEGEQGEILKDGNESVKFITSHGHTPHQIHPYTQEYMYMADILPTSNHVKIPWVMGYDIAAGQSTEDKKKIYQFLIQHQLK
jgi:glyoxylase-like metal-dependent hydrolase (beta-lactamase superfamily II)